MAHQVGTKKDLNIYNIHNWIYRLHIYIYWTLIELRLSAPQKLGGGTLSLGKSVWRDPGHRRMEESTRVFMGFGDVSL
jgi:hypothetical protein